MVQGDTWAVVCWEWCRGSVVQSCTSVDMDKVQIITMLGR